MTIAAFLFVCAIAGILQYQINAVNKRLDYIRDALLSDELKAVLDVIISEDDLPKNCGNCPLDHDKGYEQDCCWPDCVHQATAHNPSMIALANEALGPHEKELQELDVNEKHWFWNGEPVTWHEFCDRLEGKDE